MADSFIHLHTHSSYSLSEGAIKVDKLPGLALAAGMPAVALTDTANLFGALEFAQYASGKGIQPIMGCQLWLSRAATGEERPEALRAGADAVVALAMNAQGLENLQRLSSLGWLGEDVSGKPALSLEQLLSHAPGLMLLTGGDHGPLSRLLAEGRREAAVRLLKELGEAYDGRLVVELMRHHTDRQQALEPGLLRLADEAGLPIVATNDVYFAEEKTHVAHDALLCIAEGRLVAEQNRRRVTPHHWFKPADAMRALFADLPEACDNTLAIARMCAVMAESKKPELPICPKVLPGRTEAETVADMAREGLKRRFPDGVPAEHAERLEYELGVIEQMGFSGYFLIVADFIQWAKQHDIPVGPGRGSGAGSVAAWALSITDLDPLRFGLLFERFLNPERVSMPDFDIDFCQDRRDEVIDYVRREYGADRVAQIITFGKLQAKAAVRDVGRVLGMPYGQVDKIASLIPNNPANPVSLADAIKGEPKLQEMQETDEAIAKLLDTALQVEGLYRNASTHAAGVVIGRKPLIEITSIYRDPRSPSLITQYSMKYVEQASLVKFDFLGLKTLTVLQRAVQLLKARGIEVDLDKLPLDDERTYAMLAKGDAAGVFQFEGQGMRDCLRSMRPDRFEDLIAAVSLYRPGPMENIPAYCARKHGEKWEAPHASIHHILAETYGIMVYQEQVMQIAQVMAGYSLGGADLLRRAMGKKDAAAMAKQRAIFCEGAAKNGVPAEKAGEVFDLMEKFANYGFNKSHAAAYALVAYHTAWLKANHPVAFLAASMSLDLDKTEKLASHMQEAARLGIKVLPPDINKSGAEFTIEDREDGPAIRFALAAIKRVGLQAMRDLVAARDAPFTSIADFAARVDPKLLNKMQLENLAKAGAFDSLEGNRARLVAGAETVLRRAQATAEDRASNQIGLFGEVEQGPPLLRLPEIPDWPQLDKLGFEAEAVGFHLSAHPLDEYKGALRRLGATPSALIGDRARAGSTRLKLAGTVNAKKERNTRTGSRMAWISLSDQAGSYEVTFFSEVLNRSRDMLEEGTALLITAEAKLEGEALRLTAMDVERLDKAAAGVGQGMRIFIDAATAVPDIRAILERDGRGKGRVSLIPRLAPGQEVEVTLPGGWNVSPRMMQAMKLVAGVASVEEV
ncbi:DNA polymerase III subunit alpha [Roseococcus sp. SDR]|uniref:DNA polymerase III subunit alpha n=1 Tax=Roseococcus sp. SDR TaxID=2835532 RepID=UPI001BD14645|nr:DNA polymerase III subunit alpha [Roseococcus sp. SDR]MBS7790572.1 DNA polymerase III subunit alpha [Roseococcus sp. SDR]MBV1845886.1 DNA polymerase III subunit alpha [Roseococcus sp. SDR]